MVAGGWVSVAPFACLTVTCGCGLDGARRSGAVTPVSSAPRRGLTFTGLVGSCSGWATVIQTPDVDTRLGARDVRVDVCSAGLADGVDLEVAA